MEHVLPGRRHPAAGQIGRARVEGDDPKAVAIGHLSQRLHDAAGEGLDLGSHAARNVEDEGVVRPPVERLQVHARGDDHHEGSRSGGVDAIGNQLHAARQVVLEAVVEDQVAVQLRALLLQLEDVVPLALLLGRGGGLESGDARHGHGPGRFQLDVRAEVSLDPAVARPEVQGFLVRASFLERVNVAADPHLDLQGLVVEKTDAGLAARAHGVNGKLEGVELVLLRQARIPAARTLLRVDPARLVPGQDLAVQLILSGVDRHLGEARALGNGKGINGLEVAVVRVEEGLVHLGHGKAVVDDHVDIVIEDPDRLTIGILRRQDPRTTSTVREKARDAQDRGHGRQGCSSDQGLRLVHDHVLPQGALGLLGMERVFHPSRVSVPCSRAGLPERT